MGYAADKAVVASVEEFLVKADVERSVLYSYLLAGLRNRPLIHLCCSQRSR